MITILIMMKSQLRTSAILAVLMGLASPFVLQAQNHVSIEIDDPTFEALQSPDVNIRNSKSWSPKDWLEVEVEFEVDKVAPADALFVDNLTVKWYVAVENPQVKGKFLLLEKVVEHVNIPVKEKLFTSVYLSPSSINRLTGGGRAGERTVKYVGGEILFNGKRVVAFSSEGKVRDTPWWQSPSLSRSDKIPLMSKDETPFNIFWWDRYAENKVENR